MCAGRAAEWQADGIRRHIAFTACGITAAFALAVPAAAQNDYESRFVGYLGDGSGAAYHRAGQGGLHMLVLTDGNSSLQPVRYRACFASVPAGRFRRCYTRRSVPAGTSKINISLTLNDTAGPGRYLATWTVTGRRVASWRFRLFPEFGEG